MSRPSREDIVFYTNPMSRGRIARWMLEEIGQPYDTVILDYGTTMKDANYLAINPMGKVSWILGDRFSAADVYAGSQIAWGLQFKTLPEREAFKAYAGRLQSREAAGRARAIDDALLAPA